MGTFLKKIKYNFLNCKNQIGKVITILCGFQSNIGAVRSTAVPLLKQVLEPLSHELVNMLQGGIDPDSTTTTTTTPASAVLQYPPSSSSTTTPNTSYYQ